MSEEIKNIPKHVAIIMDGNGRWATQRNKYRTSGHKAGVESVRRTIRQSSKIGIKWLTLFAFSSENWKRPEKEVSMLMELFTRALKKEVPELHENGVRLSFIGDLSRFSDGLRKRMRKVEELTQGNTKMVLTIAVNYGGRWDMMQAAKQLAVSIAAQKLSVDDVSEKRLESFLSMSGIPHPDLLIRTGGDFRISNFLLWQLAYTELYFTKTLWPDFDEVCLNNAVTEYQNRERRFGKIPTNAKNEN